MYLLGCLVGMDLLVGDEYGLFTTAYVVHVANLCLGLALAATVSWEHLAGIC